MFWVALAGRGLGNALKQTKAVLFCIITHSLLSYNDSFSAGQESYYLVWNPAVHYCVPQFHNGKVTEHTLVTWRSKLFHCYACTAIEMCCCIRIQYCATFITHSYTFPYNTSGHQTLQCSEEHCCFIIGECWSGSCWGMQRGPFNLHFFHIFSSNFLRSVITVRRVRVLSQMGHWHMDWWYVHLY